MIEAKLILCVVGWVALKKFVAAVRSAAGGGHRGREHKDPKVRKAYRIFQRHSTGKCRDCKNERKPFYLRFIEGK